MLDVTDDTLTASVNHWLAQFGSALAAGDPAAVAALFRPDSHWRDLVAFSWGISTTSGMEKIAAALVRHNARAKAGSFALDPARSAPRMVMRGGSAAIEAFFRFETAHARGQGVLRLDPTARKGDLHQAWTLFTATDEIKGHEEQVGSRRPRGQAWSRDFAGPNWQDRRHAEAAYSDRDPDVLVVGGGQAGMSIAARLNQLGIDTLVVDREKRIGDNWRLRYHALTLHNQVQVNHFPYMPFPPNFPTYIPKDKLANWFESYAEAMEINFWTETEFVGAVRVEKTGRWEAQLRRADGSTRTLRPKHVVMANSASGTPNLPEIAGLANFKGAVIHASGYRNADLWVGRPVLVIGTGTSGHDIAQDLVSKGSLPTLVQRNPTLILDVEPTAQLPYTIYNEGRALEECDLIAASMPLALFEEAHRLMAQKAREMDSELHAQLRRAGFRINETDKTGWQFMFLNRGGGYYFNVGASNLIAEGKLPVAQFADIEAFVANGARMKSGATLRADLIVLATGYKNQGHLVQKFFGDEVAGRVGRVWGINAETQELNSMFTHTGQPGLWFIAGSFAQCRINSKYLALQMKAVEEGLAEPRL